MQFVKVPLAAAVAALTLTGCNLPGNCAKAPEAASTAATTTQAAAGGSAVRKTTTTTVTRVDRPRVRRDRGEGGYRYASRDDGYAGGRRYAGGVSVSVSETETSSASYRYAETEERYGSRGGYAYGSSSSGGYASTGGGYQAPPPPMAGPPARHPGYNLAGTDRQGYLTWPGKVED